MPWWPFGSGGGDKPTSTAEAAKTDRPSAKLDPAKLPERERLPKNLQKIVDDKDKEDSFYDELVDGYAPESTQSNVRYAAYAARARTILVSAHRYVAYTSDIGESFRPIAHPWLVRSAYGLSWAYIAGDVSYEGYKAYWANQRARDPSLELTPRQQHVTGITTPPAPAAAAATARQTTTQAQPGKTQPTTATQPQQPAVSPLEDYRTVMVQRAIFQSVASMGLPAFTIHSAVRYSGQAMKGVKNATVRTWAPIGLGLSIVPFLPALFDKPVENAVEWAFHRGFEAFGGSAAVGEAPVTGRERQLSQKPPRKEKDL